MTTLPHDSYDTTLPHESYISAVVDALAAADLAPGDWWTSDAVVGCTYMLDAVIEWANKTEGLSHGMLLMWEYSAGEWKWAARRKDGSNEQVEFVPLLRSWAEPDAVVAATRELLAGRKPTVAVVPLWDGAEAARAAVDAWGRQGDTREAQRAVEAAVVLWRAAEELHRIADATTESPLGPGIGHELADVLTQTADTLETTGAPCGGPIMRLARAILGEVS